MKKSELQGTIERLDEANRKRRETNEQRMWDAVRDLPRGSSVLVVTANGKTFRAHVQDVRIEHQPFGPSDVAVVLAPMVES